jgi:hypothetical protein
VRHVLFLAAALSLTGGCGVPQELSKQAEDVHSVAAEGALLAHEASEGSSTNTFTREHAKALQNLLGELRPAIENTDLAQIAAKVDAMLAALAEEPGRRGRAVLLERALDRAAKTADELAG